MTESTLEKPVVERHPSDEGLALFMRGALPRDEAREVVRHLLSGCVACRKTTGAWWPNELTRGRGPARVVPFDERERAAAHDYQPIFSRVARTLAERERDFAAERRATPDLHSELLALPHTARLERIATDARFSSWALVESLLDESREHASGQPADAVALAELATGVAERLDEARYSAAAVHDLRSRAWGQLGSALRIQNRLWEAQKALDTARQYLERGSGDPAERCRLLVLQAALYGELKRFDEAFALLDRVINLAERCGEDHLRGSALIRKARLAAQRDDQETAVELLRQGVALIDPDEDPRLVLVAGHNLVHMLADTGRYREARERLDETRALHLQFGGRIDHVRFRWLEAKVYQGLGWLEQAAAHYEEVRRSFIDEGLGYDVALVSLELATVYSQEGKHAEVRRLADEVLPLFSSQKAHQEALAALIFFRDAARKEAATVPLIREVADYLRRWRSNPGLRFRGGDARC
jgi:tetratricopeptide (TPR) repeat protein